MPRIQVDMLAAVTVALALSLIAPAPAFAASSCGGTGGTRTQTFTCGPGELVTALVAEGGAYVNRITVKCSRITGELQDARSSQGKESGKLGGKPPGSSISSGFALCPDGTAAWSIDPKCGWYVDRLVSITCGQVKADAGRRVLTRAVNLRYLNVGGNGGDRTGLTCGADKGIYKVTVRSGDWIDRIEIACRAP
jgi:hypothetical protein